MAIDGSEEEGRLEHSSSKSTSKLSSPTKSTSRCSTRQRQLEADIISQNRYNNEVFYLIRFSRVGRKGKYYFKRIQEFQTLHEQLVSEYKKNSKAVESLPQLPDGGRWGFRAQFSFLGMGNFMEKLMSELQTYLDTLLDQVHDSDEQVALRDFFGSAQIPDVSADMYESLSVKFKGLAEHAELMLPRSRRNPDPTFAVGSYVHIKNLQNKPQFNGLLAQVLSMKEDGRFEIQLQKDGRTKVISAECLQLAQLPKTASSMSVPEPGPWSRSAPTNSSFGRRLSHGDTFPGSPRSQARPASERPHSSRHRKKSSADASKPRRASHSPSRPPRSVLPHEQGSNACTPLSDPSAQETPGQRESMKSLNMSFGTCASSGTLMSGDWQRPAETLESFLSVNSEVGSRKSVATSPAVLGQRGREWKDMRPSKPTETLDSFLSSVSENRDSVSAMPMERDLCTIMSEKPLKLSHAMSAEQLVVGMDSHQDFGAEKSLKFGPMDSFQSVDVFSLDLEPPTQPTSDQPGEPCLQNEPIMSALSDSNTSPQNLVKTSGIVQSSPYTPVEVEALGQDRPTRQMSLASTASHQKEDVLQRLARTADAWRQLSAVPKATLPAVLEEAKEKPRSRLGNIRRRSNSHSPMPKDRTS